MTEQRQSLWLLTPSGQRASGEFIDDTLGYVNRLRNHMSWEERDLFRRIDAMLDADPQEFDVAEFEHIKDPVFELEIEAGFRRLIASLKSASPPAT